MAARRRISSKRSLRSAPRFQKRASQRRPATRSGVAHLLKDTSRILQKELAGWIQLHAAGQAFEKLKADFFFQILNLAGQRRLCHAQSARRAPVMLLLCVENGARRGYQVAFAEAAGRASQHIFRKLGFAERAYISYQDYVFNGRRVFESIAYEGGPTLMEKLLTPASALCHGRA